MHALVLLVGHALIVASVNGNQRDFYRNKDLDDRVCSLNDRVAADVVDSSVSCGVLCSGSTECTSYFYSEVTNDCVTCKSNSLTFSNTLPSPSMLNYDDGACSLDGSFIEGTSCKDLFLAGNTVSGIYNLRTPITSTSILAYCDMTTEGGGWMVWQRRITGALTFHDKLFADYDAGFGYPSGEHWLGLKHLQEFLEARPSSVYILFRDFDGTWAHEWHNNFTLSAGPDYTIQVTQFISADYPLVHDGFQWTNGKMFSASDHNYDSCVDSRGGAAFWWYSCGPINANGEYGFQGADGLKYMYNKSWKMFLALKETKLMIRETC